MLKHLMMEHMMSYMSNLFEILKIAWHIPGTYHYAFLEFLIPAISALAGAFGNRPSTQQNTGYQDLTQTGNQQGATTSNTQNQQTQQGQQTQQTQGGSSTINQGTNTTTGQSQTSGATTSQGTTSQTGQTTNQQTTQQQQQNYSNTLQNMLSNIFGQTSQTGTQQTTGTSTPTLLPEAQGLLSQLSSKYGASLNQDTDLSGYEAQGLTNINQAATQREEAINNALAARGIRGAAAGGAISKAIAARYSDISTFENSLPLLRDQMQQDKLKAASGFFGTIPTGTQATGTTTSQQTGTSQQQQTGQTTGQTTGGATTTGQTTDVGTSQQYGTTQQSGATSSASTNQQQSASSQLSNTTDWQNVLNQTLQNLFGRSSTVGTMDQQNYATSKGQTGGTQTQPGNILGGITGGLGQALATLFGMGAFNKSTPTQGSYDLGTWS